MLSFGMRWLDSLERRFHFVAIPEFPLFIATSNGLIYLMGRFNPAFVERLFLDPAAIHAGEWWRVITFLFVPPMDMNPIFLVFWLLFLYQVAQGLENVWGEFRFFFFYLVGAVMTVLASLYVLHEPIGNVSLNTSLYLAFATLFPDFAILIFPLPWSVKVKYLAWAGWVVIGCIFIFGSFNTRVAIGASLSNYALFFGVDIWKAALLKWEVFRNRRRLRP
jgi:membrane associated rhomboid family serine protease